MLHAVTMVKERVYQKAQQTAFDDFGFDALEWAVPFFDTVAALHIEHPLVFGAGQGAAREWVSDVSGAEGADAISSSPPPSAPSQR